MLFSFPLYSIHIFFLFIKRNFIFSISIYYSLLPLSFQLLKLVFLFSFRRFISYNFVFLLFPLFPFYPHCLHYLPQLIGIVFFFLSHSISLQIFFVSIFSSSIIYKYYSYCVIIDEVSRFRTNSIIELLPRGWKHFKFHHGRYFKMVLLQSKGDRLFPTTVLDWILPRKQLELEGSPKSDHNDQTVTKNDFGLSDY